MVCSHRMLAMTLSIGLGLASGAACGAGESGAERRLVIDPGTFSSIEQVAAAETGSSRSRVTIQTGPRIVLRLPGDNDVFAAQEQVSVHVEFLPATDGIEPNMDTLKVRVRMGWFGRDITELVEPYVEGMAVRVPEVDFSGYTGRFHFEIRIRDYEDRVGEAEFSVQIRG